MSAAITSVGAVDETRALEREAYVTEEWHRLDLQHLFSQRWLFAGHASQIPDPGSFTSYDLPGWANILIVRNRDGSVSAFHNVCRHRGARICTETSGKVKRNFV